MRGMSLVQAHVADFMIEDIQDRDAVRLLEHLHAEVIKDERHPAGPALIDRIESRAVVHLFFGVRLHDCPPPRAAESERCDRQPGGRQCSQWERSRGRCACRRYRPLPSRAPCSTPDRVPMPAARSRGRANSPTAGRNPGQMRRFAVAVLAAPAAGAASCPKAGVAAAAANDANKRKFPRRISMRISLHVCCPHKLRRWHFLVYAPLAGSKNNGRFVAENGDNQGLSPPRRRALSDTRFPAACGCTG